MRKHRGAELFSIASSLVQNLVLYPKEKKKTLHDSIGKPVRALQEVLLLRRLRALLHTVDLAQSRYPCHPSKHGNPG